MAQHRPGPPGNDFDAVGFVHHALAGVDRGDVGIGTRVAGMSWGVPVYINAMTGGSAETGRINRQLAVVARETGVPIAAGSMSAYLRDESVAETYRVLRSANPNGIVLANVNANVSVDQARRAVELVAADALQIHLNTVQEIVMPEGDRSFGHWPGQIERIVAGCAVPVIVKEVGFGLSRRTVAMLRDAGVAAADVGGRGGTNFARIENNRRPDSDFGCLDEWGQSTVSCLLDCADFTGIDILASGGIRSPLDIARALALGAAAGGVAGHFLEILLTHGTDTLIATITDWSDKLTGIMTVLGARAPAELTGCDLIVTGAPAEYARARGIDLAALANRSTHRPLPQPCRSGADGFRTGIGDDDA